MALEWAGYGIRVLGIASGAIETEANAKEIAAFGREKFEDWIPFSRLGNTKKFFRELLENQNFANVG